jgi:hypothetical protein
MCFYCHKLYYFPYAPLHSYLDCPELAKINNSNCMFHSKINQIINQPIVKTIKIN